MGGTENDTAAASASSPASISEQKANVVETGSLLSENDLRGLPDLLHAPGFVSPRVTLYAFDAWLRSVPPGISIAVRPQPPKRYLVSFSSPMVRELVAVSDENAEFNVVDFAPNSVPCPVSMLLEEIRPSLALRPDACVMIDCKLMSVPSLPTIVLGSDHEARFVSTAMNPYRFQCVGDALNALADAMNRRGLGATSVRHARDAVFDKLTSDALLEHSFGANDVPIKCLVAGLVAERAKRVDPLYRVGDLWFAAKGLDRSFPRLLRNGDWLRLFRSTSDANGLRLYECLVDEVRMNENFGPETSVVDRILQQISGK